MSQKTDDIQASYPLFQQEEYQQSLDNKRDQFEEPHSQERVDEVFEWTTTEEYKELNFQREQLTVNPAKACQPLGSVLCSLGFEKTLPYVHGSQGCVAYFRTYFNRHFKEPVACVSDSMSEDAAVFGGYDSMYQGLKNADAVYQPEMISVSTTCMAEVIGDDLNGFIGNAKNQGYIDSDKPTPYAHTPSFVGSHTTGWDNMLDGVLRYFTLDSAAEQQTGANGKVNIVPGFETYLGNYRVIRRMLGDMGVEATILSDPSEVLDTPADGEYRLYSGGTTFDEVREAPSALETFYIQPWQADKSRKFIRSTWDHEAPDLDIPMGLSATDAFLMKVSEVTGQPIPESLEKERGRLVDMMTDSHQWVHGKRFVLWGDPDFAQGMTKFLLELGAEPIHVLSSNGNKKWRKTMQEMLAASPYGQNSEVHMKKDLWHMRSLVFTDQPDFMIGNSYGKFIQRDTRYKGEEYEVPLIRFGFPLFDRHHKHRETTLGYEGAMNILTTIVNSVLEKLDDDTRGMGTTDYNYDLIR